VTAQWKAFTTLSGEMMYPNLEHIIAYYLGVNVGYSEDEAVTRIRDSLSQNSSLAISYRNELSTALAETEFSWKDTFSRYEAFDADTEEEARSYAREFLWDTVLNG